MADEIEVVEDVQPTSPNDAGVSRDAANPPTDTTGATAGTDAALDQLSAKVDELGRQYEDGNKEVSQRLDSVEKGLADNTALMRGRTMRRKTQKTRHTRYKSAMHNGSRCENLGSGPSRSHRSRYSSGWSSFLSWPLCLAVVCGLRLRKAGGANG